MIELRVAMDLASLWRQSDRRAEGQRLLADVHGWFTEGYETNDLRDARRLLAELAVLEGSRAVSGPGSTGPERAR
jgi:hypothetical protein